MDIRILIVDDDDAIRDAMQEFLEISGFEVAVAQSAEEAVNVLRTKYVQVVITDITLPGMDGFQLTDRIKQDYQDIDIVVMTGYSGDYSYEEAINKGASDFVFKPVRFEELLLRVKRVLRERKLSNERVHMLEKLKKLSITDGLTKLYNSRHFYNQLKGEVDRSNRYKHPLSLLIMDIDNFKDYNDSYGHLEGDKVLVRIGKVIKPLLRKMDSAYRYGGEEFTFILPETIGSEAETVAQRIRKAVKAEVFSPTGTEDVSISVSLGVTEYCPKEDVPVFIQRADKALYQSKESGRDRVSSIFVE
jgi:diguanylate cyclase (GGDEF)-like protein